MVRRTIKRLLTATGAVAVAAALAVGVMPSAAQAEGAPKAAKPTAVEVAGKGISSPIVIRQENEPKLFQMVLNEVSWLAAESPQTSAPKADKLGPKYTVRLLVKDAPHQIYDLYPQAAGGPRAYRPSKQPTGKKAAGWFYGRLSMSESLRLSGAPLKAKPDVVNGGIGGGVGEDLSAGEVNAMESMTEAFTEMRRLFLLNGAVLLIILVGLAGMAFLIRRRV
ncbi:hypothetical protein [Actinoplanes sp. GCM10030250]|uniref:hypothetical protein n=1 Tax=Actinoplanes sp. GCM10030250 TaxID=3273376 RepID=UPI003615414A